MILSDWLKETGRTVEGFAAEIHKSRQAVHRYINGSRFPKPGVIREIDRVSDGKVAAPDWYSAATREAAE
jgi:hypothetical protein